MKRILAFLAIMLFLTGCGSSSESNELEQSMKNAGVISWKQVNKVDYTLPEGNTNDMLRNPEDYVNEKLSLSFNVNDLISEGDVYNEYLLSNTYNGDFYYGLIPSENFVSRVLAGDIIEAYFRPIAEIDLEVNHDDGSNEVVKMPVGLIDYYTVSNSH